jgi:hypothetical protein
VDSKELSRTASGVFGRIAFGFLAISVLSGVALAPFWSAERPFDSLEQITGAIPWGFFLRSLHVVSAYALLVTAVWHVVEVLARRTERQLGAGAWWLSVSLLPLAVCALLGGFVMRGDAEANAALAIWRRITESLPAVGPRLAALFLGTSPHDLGAVALHHAGSFTLLLWLLTAAHAERLAPDLRSWTLAGLVTVALAGALPIGLGHAPSAEAPHLLQGPWYLLGLQGALMNLPVFLGWSAPLALVLLLGLVRHAAGRARGALLASLLALLAADLAFTARLFLSAR